MDLDTLREICMAYPGATEELQWEVHLLYKVGGKIFCIGSLNVEDGVTLKVNEEDFDELVAQPGIQQASHMAKRMWVNISPEGKLSLKEWKAYINNSYELIKAKLPKKVQASL
jgi:predicted DNA-binding protein (MmcQ/YjbR family)